MPIYYGLEIPLRPSGEPGECKGELKDVVFYTLVYSEPISLTDNSEEKDNGIDK
jgi:hypothetical protein